MTDTQQPPRVLVVGGVAAGASAAARARRLHETAQITIIERGPDVSFANCGMPYHIGGEIPSRSALAVQTPESLRDAIDVDVRTCTTALRIDREGKRVLVQRKGGEEEWLPYDKLVLAPGAAPIRPPLPGIDDPSVCTLRSLTDMDRIAALSQSGSVRSIAIVGAGFIGLELAEQFVRQGHQSVSVIEMQTQVLPPFDHEMTRLVEDEVAAKGVQLVMGDGIAGFERVDDDTLVCRLASGRGIEASLVVLAIGVRPESGLARDAGLELGPRGHIRVSPFMQTSDPDIYAAGDAVEGTDLVFGEPAAVALAGLANRGGRVAADHMFAPEAARPLPGSLGTAIMRAFDVAAGLTGWTEKRLAAAGKPCATVTVNGLDHAGYFPGAQPLMIKICWDPESLRLLGGQVVGLGGVDKRVDVLATAIRGRLTVEDLAELELAYAPPFGMAKDLLNVAGFAACNRRDGLVRVADAVPDVPDLQVVDTRPAALCASHPLPIPCVNIPVTEIRARCDAELDKSKPVLTVCGLGKSSYFSARVLAKHGFDVQSLNGGIRRHFDPRSPAAGRTGGTSEEPRTCDC